jgi:hypothetical protein
VDKAGDTRAYSMLTARMIVDDNSLEFVLVGEALGN